MIRKLLYVIMVVMPCLLVAASQSLVGKVGSEIDASSVPIVMLSHDEVRETLTRVFSTQRYHPGVMECPDDSEGLPYGTGDESATAVQDKFWSENFPGPPGTDGSVYAVAHHNGNMYVGGQFSAAYTLVSARNVARWDGVTWHPLGSGLDGPVHALVCDTQGMLYAAGEFSQAGGSAASNIARWDGSTWSPLGSGVNGKVSALAIGQGGLVYAGGAFTTAGGASALRIAAWDGQNWTALGLGCSNEVLCLELDNSGFLYAGGLFWFSGGSWVAHVAKWDGSVWSALGSGFQEDVCALFFDYQTGTLYAGGEFDAPPSFSDGFAFWDGGAWQYTHIYLASSWDLKIAAIGNDGAGNFYISERCSISNSALGSLLIRWDRENSEVLSSFQRDTEIFSLTSDENGFVYAGGTFTQLANVGVSNIIRFDGTTWSSFGTGFNDSSMTLARGPDGTLYAGGKFCSAGDVTAHRVAQWNGRRWKPLGDGFNDDVYTLAVNPKSGQVYAGGKFFLADGQEARVARWNGSLWESLAMNSPYCHEIYSLIALRNGTLIAGGRFDQIGTQWASNVAEYNGKQWKAVGPNGPDDAVRSLAFDEEHNFLYAGGEFTQVGSFPVKHIARFDYLTGNWSSLGNGISYGDVYSIAVDQGAGVVYAGVNESGTASKLYRWNGQYWSSMSWYPTGVDQIYTLAFDQNNDLLYVGGEFSSQGSVSLNNIAVSDGYSWSALGSGTNGDVLSIFVDDSGLILVGGEFNQAGGKPSFYIGQYSGKAHLRPKKFRERYLKTVCLSY